MLVFCFFKFHPPEVGAENIPVAVKLDASGSAIVAFDNGRLADDVSG